MNLTTAKVIADSISRDGIRLITLQTRAPKFLDAEVEKHRMISTNSSSDRAKPISRMLSEHPYVPADVYLNKPGMQGAEHVDPDDLWDFTMSVEQLYDHAVRFCKRWEDIHKQHINRYLLPFSYQDKVMTATLGQYEAFFRLRLHSAAQPEIYKLAEAMRDAIDESEPEELRPKQWHLPYVSENEALSTIEAIQCSIARCARVSYSNHDGSDPVVENDLKLYKMLVEMEHMSCFEHQAKPMDTVYSDSVKTITEKGISHIDIFGNCWSANFKGWIQYRKVLEQLDHTPNEI